MSHIHRKSCKRRAQRRSSSHSQVWSRALSRKTSRANLPPTPNASAPLGQYAGAVTSWWWSWGGGGGVREDCRGGEVRLFRANLDASSVTRSGDLRPHRRGRSKHPSLNRPRTSWKSWRGGARRGAAGGRGKRGRSWRRWTATPSSHFRGAFCSAKIAPQGSRKDAAERRFFEPFVSLKTLFSLCLSLFLLKGPSSFALRPQYM